MDAANQTEPPLPVTNGTTSMTDGNSGVAAESLESNVGVMSVQAPSDAQMQAQGISAGSCSFSNYAISSANVGP